MSELQEVQEIVGKSRTDRRRFLANAGLGVAGLGLAAAGATSASAQMSTQNIKAKFGEGKNKFSVKDEDILNFALNLEYLEAEFYLRALTGTGLSDADSFGFDKKGNEIAPGAVTGGRQVNFEGNPIFQGLAAEVAADELAHVRALRAVLGKKAVPRPEINIGSSFAAAAVAAGVVTNEGVPFDPYANASRFLLGAFLFEDVGVTAYKGAAPLIKDADILEAAAGVLAVEAYHAGAIRTILLLSATLGIANQPPAPANINVVQAFSNLRDNADGPGDKDQGIFNDPNALPATTVNIVPTDANALAFSRTFAEVLGIVYLGGPIGTGGGFFPSGLTGRIR